MNKKNWRLWVWLFKWVDLAEAIVSILSLTYYETNWGMNVRCWQAIRDYEEEGC